MREHTLAICIPTFRRPRLLRACLESIATLEPPETYLINTIVVDNDVNATAKEICEEVSPGFLFALHYFVHSERGLSEVRNRLLDEAIRLNAGLIAFIDDDEQAGPGWLRQHCHYMAQFKADVCSGPVRQVGINAEEEKRAQTGSRPRHVSTNNVVFRASLVSRQGLRFDPYFNFIGGEDFDFFERSNDIGNQHIWVDEALVLEAVTEQRESLAYLFYRHYSGGINNVLRYRRRQPTWKAWSRFLPKFIGKCLGAFVCLILAILTVNRTQLHKATKKIASGLGYLAGLLNIVVERYRHPATEPADHALLK